MIQSSSGLNHNPFEFTMFSPYFSITDPALMTSQMRVVMCRVALTSVGVETKSWLMCQVIEARVSGDEMREPEMAAYVEDVAPCGGYAV
jgi:hypothetical protein